MKRTGLKVEDFNWYMKDITTKLSEVKEAQGYYQITPEEMTQIAQVAFRRTVEDYKEAQISLLEQSKLNINDLSSLNEEELRSKLIAAKQVESVLLEDINLKAIGNQHLADKLNEYVQRIEELENNKSSIRDDAYNAIQDKNDIIKKKEDQIKELNSLLVNEARKRKILTASSWINYASKWIITDESKRMTVDTFITGATSAYVIKDLDNYSYEITWMILAIVIWNSIKMVWRWCNKGNSKVITNNYYDVSRLNDLKVLSKEIMKEETLL